MQDRQSCQDWLCARTSHGRRSLGGMSGSFRTKPRILVKLSLPCGMPDRATVCGRGLACVRSGGCILGRQVLRVRHPCRLCPACLRRELRTRRRCGDVPTGLGSPAWLRLQVSRCPVAALDEILDSLFPCRLLPVKSQAAFGPPFAGLPVFLLLLAYCHLSVCVQQRDLAPIIDTHASRSLSNGFAYLEFACLFALLPMPTPTSRIATARTAMPARFGQGRRQ